MNEGSRFLSFPIAGKCPETTVAVDSIDLLTLLALPAVIHSRAAQRTLQHFSLT